jgi:hydrogenase nickel incorporation protein HypB
MCTVCGCTPEASGTEAAAPHHHAGGTHEHVLADGTVQRHADHPHTHEHVLADGTVERHADHDHEDAHDDSQPHRHEHAHDGAPHTYEHTHQHVLADGTAVRHSDHDHEHAHDDSQPHTHEHGADHTDTHEHAADHAHTHQHVLADGTLERHADHDHEQAHDDSKPHDHEHPHHDHERARVKDGTLKLDHGPAGTEVPGMTQRRLVEIETSILGKNDALAAKNRTWFEGLGVKSFNLISSPGAGKTTLLVETLKSLEGHPMAVIEGDQQTDLDATRIRATGVQAIQINTGKGCHLDAQMVRRALDGMKIARETVLFIENVGNLVCPAGFDLGEGARVALLSITEGEDKPLKYPDAFAGADVVLITKLDLQPLVQANLELLRANILQVQPKAKIIEVSARTGEGLEAWTTWLLGEHARSAANA